MNCRRLVPGLVASAILSVLPCGLLSQNKSDRQCSVANMSVSLTGNTDFQQSIGNLTFEMKPLKQSSGWMLSFEDANGHDLICPVNNPIRTCEEEQVGAGYGETAKQALSHGRELRFLLSTADYDRFEPYVERALGHSTEAESIKAGEEYFNQNDNLRTGLLRVTIIRADVSETDEVRSADLKIEFVAPAMFPFAAVLRAKKTACPELTLPIDERIVSRVPAPNPRAYRNVRDAADWMNPYLVITAEGFDLRFQGGQIHGPLSILRRTVAGLPTSVWPYGRVIAASENGVRGLGTTEILDKNKEEAEKILRELGLTVEWWPSA